MAENATGIVGCVSVAGTGVAECSVCCDGDGDDGEAALLSRGEGRNRFVAVFFTFFFVSLKNLLIVGSGSR